MAIAALPVIIVALVAILILLAFTPLQRVIVALVAELPVVGGWIVQNSTAAIDRAYAKVVTWAIASVGVLVGVIFLPFYYLDHFNKAAQSSTLETMYALRRVVDNVIPRTYQAAINFAWNAGQNAMHFAWDVGQNAMHFAWDVGQNVSHYAEALVARAVSYSEQLFNQATAYTRALAASTAAYAEDLVRQATRYAEGLFDRASRYAEALAAQGVRFIDDAFGRSLDFERQLYGQSLRYAEALTGQLGKYAERLFERANLFTLAQVAAVGVRVLRLERSKCQQFCEPLGDLGDLLQQVETLGMAALLLGLAGEMAHDPRGTARAIEQLIGPEVREITGGLAGEAGFRRAA